MMNRILIAIGIALAVSTQAQEKKVSFGLRAGLNLQNFNGKGADGTMLKNQIVAGYHLGMNLEILMAPDFYLQPGLLFSTKGSKWTSSKASLNYIEVPINFLYKPILGSGRFMLGFGPYLAYGIGGKATYSGTSYKVKYAASANENDAAYTFKPFDAGANLFVGYEFKNRISFQINSQLGLVKINPSYTFIPNDKTVIKNTGFGISAGYRF